MVPFSNTLVNSQISVNDLQLIKSARQFRCQNLRLSSSVYICVKSGTHHCKIYWEFHAVNWPFTFPLLERTKGQFSWSRKRRHVEKKKVRKINKYTETLLLSCCSVGVDGAASGQKWLQKNRIKKVKQPQCQLCFAQHWKELQFCDANVAQGAALNNPSPPHTHTHTHPPLLCFLPFPAKADATTQAPGATCVAWDPLPSPPPPLNLLLPHIDSAKQSPTYLAPYLIPLQLMSQPLTSSLCHNNSNKKTSLAPCSTELVKQHVLLLHLCCRTMINETLLRGNVDSHPGEVYFDPDCLQ